MPFRIACGRWWITVGEWIEIGAAWQLVVSWPCRRPIAAY